MEHLVARCPTCSRPVWAKQLARILGFVTKGNHKSALGFVAITRGKGQGKGWRVLRGLESLAEVFEVGGVEAVEQLRKLARRSLSRMWALGLLSAEDVRAVTASHVAPGEVSTAPAPVIRHSFNWDNYKPGSRIVSKESPKLAKLDGKTDPAPVINHRFQP